MMAWGTFAAQTCRAADQPFVVLFEQLLVDARLVIEPLGKRVGDHLAEVVVAFEVLGRRRVSGRPAVSSFVFFYVTLLPTYVPHTTTTTSSDRPYVGRRWYVRSTYVLLLYVVGTV